MKHLIADLLRYHDPFWTGMVPVAAFPLIACGLWMLRWTSVVGGWRRLAGVIACAFGMAATTFATFWGALRGSYPLVEIALPIDSAMVAIAISMGSGLAAATILTFANRSARNVLLAGSLIASGFSCSIFTGLAGLVAPFALSYDLTAVLTVMLVGSALVSFSLWENINPHRTSILYSATLGTLAIVVLAFGSVSSVLSFRDWMTAVAAPDDITSSPVIVIAAAQAGVALALMLVGSLIDNRSARRDQLEAERLHQLAEATFEAIVIHRDGVVIDGNANLAKLVGGSLPDLVGREIASFLPFDAHSIGGGRMRRECELASLDGRRTPVEVLSRPISHRSGHAVITALRDITDRRASEARIRFLAHHDALTELPNRALLSETLEQSVWRSRASGEPIAVLCLDLDGFKLVNDTHGHAAGDELLRQVAFRIKACLGEREFFARIGGDEFVLIQTGSAQPASAMQLAKRIVVALQPEFQLEAGVAHVGTSVGIAVHPDDGQTPETLLKRADIALYRAKHDGRGWYRCFEGGMNEAVDERRSLERDLRHAQARGELKLVYQPIFDRDSQLVCFEALLRWTHPRLGPISPAEFIPLAEERGLIVALGDWVLREACRTAISWPTPCRVAVNVSPVQLMRGDLPERVAAILAESGLEAGRLELELTEGVLLNDLGVARDLLFRLRALGVHLVLDDFGSKYSSLAYLHELPFHKIKIDRTFIDALDVDTPSLAIVRAVVALGRDLGLGVTVEGVETQQQIELLPRGMCDELQGFLLGRPMEAADAHRMILDQLNDRAVASLRSTAARAIQPLLAM